MSGPPDPLREEKRTGDEVSALIELDRQAFEIINSDWSSPAADWFFPAITDLHTQIWFIVVAVALLAFWIYRARKDALKWIAALAITLALSDMVAYRVVKPSIERLRPPASGVHVIVRGPEHTGNSFPSNHASNIFAAATILTFALPPLGLPFFIVATLVAYSRVYVGAHFPLDVLAGAVLGIIIANLVRLALLRWLPKRSRIRNGGDSSRAQTSNQSS